MATPTPKDYRQVRLESWRERLGSGELPETLAARLDPEYPAPFWAVDSLPDGRKKLRILDINSGPITAIGRYHPSIEIAVTAIDNLAREFPKLLKSHGIEPPVPVKFCCPEDVLSTFGRDSFDIIYTYNGLHSPKDPIPVYRNLMECLAPGGRIVTFHDFHDRIDRFRGDHNRYFHYLKNGHVSIRRKDFIRNLADALCIPQFPWSLKENILKLEIERDNCRPVSPNHTPDPEGSSAEEPLPPLISMHLPKTGGSSFRRFLESLYGNRMRILYSVEETDPAIADSLVLDSSIRCLHGHFQADLFDKHLPEALKVTWLRDPVERVISSYFQFLRNPPDNTGSGFHQRVFKEGWSLMDFARSPEMIDHVLWHFNGVPFDDFLFVGITERFQESLHLFCRLIHREAPAEVAPTNVNPGKSMKAKYPLTQAQRHELLALYAEEYELYRYANYRMDEQLKAL